MERVQSLKHRENLIKGMGITDFVNRILYGTSGTVATVPPTLINHNHKNMVMSSNQKAPNQNQETLIHQIDSLNRTYTTYNPKIEIKTKNYNPFENHNIYSEVIISVCQNLGIDEKD